MDGPRGAVISPSPAENGPGLVRARSPPPLRVGQAPGSSLGHGTNGLDEALPSGKVFLVGESGRGPGRRRRCQRQVRGVGALLGSAGTSRAPVRRWPLSWTDVNDQPRKQCHCSKGEAQAGGRTGACPASPRPLKGPAQGTVTITCLCRRPSGKGLGLWPGDQSGQVPPWPQAVPTCPSRAASPPCTRTR